MRERVRRLLTEALEKAVAAGDLALEGEVPEVSVENPRNPEHGDFATGIAMTLARAARRKPRDIAEAIKTHLGDGGGLLSAVDIAGPGFINLRVEPLAWARSLARVVEEGERFGRSEAGSGTRVLVEYVSANPTGPLHVGHGRGAITGDVVATLLDWAGYEVTREFYVNDAGNQVNNLAASVHARYLELLGHTAELPEDGYHGEYVVDCARSLAQRDGDVWVKAPEDEWRPAIRAFAIEEMLDGIRDDLAAFNVRFDRFASETALHEAGQVDAALDQLRAAGLLFDEADGGVIFRATDFGDDKDRAVRKRDGGYTYLAADIAYHREKLERGFDLLINVWGADHGGYVTRMKAAIAALGRDPEALHILLVQMVNLTRDGQPVRMGKRSGQFVTLREVIDEVGRDAARFFFIMRRSDAQFEFDLALAKEVSLDNPVYYVQYGHARCASLMARAEEKGVEVPAETPSAEVLRMLLLPEELDLVQRIDAFPETVRGAAEAQEPHRLVYYLQETIAAFHSYYTRYGKTEPIIGTDAAKTSARLFLVRALKQVLKNGLDILGVDAPERMEWSED